MFILDFMQVAFVILCLRVFVVFLFVFVFCRVGCRSASRSEACLLSPQRLPVEEILGVPKAEWREEQVCWHAECCRVHGETCESMRLGMVFTGDPDPQGSIRVGGLDEWDPKPPSSPKTWVLQAELEQAWWTGTVSALTSASVDP